MWDSFFNIYNFKKKDYKKTIVIDQIGTIWEPNCSNYIDINERNLLSHEVCYEYVKMLPFRMKYMVPLWLYEFLLGYAFDENSKGSNLKELQLKDLEDV